MKNGFRTSYLIAAIAVVSTASASAQCQNGHCTLNQNQSYSSPAAQFSYQPAISSAYSAPVEPITRYSQYAPNQVTYPQPVYSQAVSPSYASPSYVQPTQSYAHLPTRVRYAPASSYSHQTRVQPANNYNYPQQYRPSYIAPTTGCSSGSCHVR